MADMKVEKREAPTAQGVERTRQAPEYVPDVDIVEAEQEIRLVADLPGVDEKSVELHLEKNILEIAGRPAVQETEGLRAISREFGRGGFRRAFELSSEVDRAGITAAVKNGVLTVTLPKSEAAVARRIPVAVG